MGLSEQPIHRSAIAGQHRRHPLAPFIVGQRRYGTLLRLERHRLAIAQTPAASDIIARAFSHPSNLSPTNDAQSSARSSQPVLARHTLRPQQRGQVVMIDPRRRLCRYDRLGVIGDAKPCRPDHRQVVGTVTDREYR